MIHYLVFKGGIFFLVGLNFIIATKEKHMSAKKLSTHSQSNNSNSNNNLIIDDTLHIEWGHISRSQSVEDHIRNISDKILERARGATHLVVHLNVDLFSKPKSPDLIRVGFELRFPKHQDLFCHSEGENLYEVLATCKQQILKMINRRKRTRIKNRTRDLSSNFDNLDFLS